MQNIFFAKPTLGNFIKNNPLPPLDLTNESYKCTTTNQNNKFQAKRKLPLKNHILII